MTNLDYKKFTDRDLLEAIFSNQVALAQKVYRISDFLLTKYGTELSEHGLHKEEIFDKLVNQDKWDLDAQLSSRPEESED